MASRLARVSAERLRLSKLLLDAAISISVHYRVAGHQPANGREKRFVASLSRKRYNYSVTSKSSTHAVLPPTACACCVGGACARADARASACLLPGRGP